MLPTAAAGCGSSAACTTPSSFYSLSLLLRLHTSAMGALEKQQPQSLREMGASTRRYVQDSVQEYLLKKEIEGGGARERQKER